MTDSMDTRLAFLRRLGGDKFVHNMIDLFLQVAQQRQREIHTGWHGRDLKVVQKAAHSLKSSAGNVGADGLSAVLQSIEQMAADNTAEGIPDLIQQFDELLGRTCTLLEEKRGAAS